LKPIFSHLIVRSQLTQKLVNARSLCYANISYFPEEVLLDGEINVSELKSEADALQIIKHWYCTQAQQTAGRYYLPSD